MLLQNPEPRPGLQRRGQYHAGGIVAGAAGIVAKPHRAVAERPLGLRIRIVVSPQALVGVAAFEVGQGEDALRAVDEFAHVQLVEAVFVVFEAQTVDIEQITTAGCRVFDGDFLAPLAIRTQRALVNGGLARPVLPQLLPRLLLRNSSPVQNGYAWWVTALGVEK